MQFNKNIALLNKGREPDHTLLIYYINIFNIIITMLSN